MTYFEQNDSSNSTALDQPSTKPTWEVDVLKSMSQAPSQNGKDSVSDVAKAAVAAATMGALKGILPECSVTYDSEKPTNHPGTDKNTNKPANEADVKEAPASKPEAEKPAEKEKTPAEKEYDERRVESKKEWAKLLPQLEKQESFKNLTEGQQLIAKFLAEAMVSGSVVLAGAARTALSEIKDEAEREKVTKAVNELMAPLKVSAQYHHNTGQLYLKDNTGKNEEVITVRSQTGLDLLAQQEYRETMMLHLDLQDLSRHVLAQAKKNRDK